LPTAQNLLVALTPSTATRRFWVESGLGVGTTDQDEPFHRVA